MDVKQVLMLSFQASILCTVAGFGLRSAPGDLTYLLARPGLLIRSLLAVLVVMPLVAVAIAASFDLRRPTEIALIALAMAPAPPLLLGREVKAGGRRSYGLALMLTLALLAIATVPLTIEVVQRLFDRQLGVAPGAIARIVLVMTVLPLVVGTAIRALMPALADRIAGPLSKVGTVLLLLAAVVLLAGTWRGVLAAVGGGTVVVMALFVTIGLMVGHLLGGPDPRDETVLALSSASRHPAIALTIASANFPDEHFAGTVILYLLVSTIVGMPYLKWQRRQVGAAAAAA
jgi:BASS family bile acid:Na+ symporter